MYHNYKSYTQLSEIGEDSLSRIGRRAISATLQKTDAGRRLENYTLGELIDRLSVTPDKKTLLVDGEKVEHAGYSSCAQIEALAREARLDLKVATGYKPPDALLRETPVKDMPFKSRSDRAFLLTMVGEDTPLGEIQDRLKYLDRGAETYLFLDGKPLDPVSVNKGTVLPGRLVGSFEKQGFPLTAMHPDTKAGPYAEQLAPDTSITEFSRMLEATGSHVTERKMAVALGNGQQALSDNGIRDVSDLACRGSPAVLDRECGFATSEFQTLHDILANSIIRTEWERPTWRTRQGKREEDPSQWRA